MKGERLGFISLCSLCLAARNEIITARQKDQASSANWMLQTIESQEFDGRRRESVGKQGFWGDVGLCAFQKLLSNPCFTFFTCCGDFSLKT